MKNQVEAQQRPLILMFREPMSSWSAWIAVSGVLLCSVGMGYWFWAQIVSAIIIYFEAVIISLGPGVLLTTLWLSIFFGAVVFKRSLFRRYNLWVASIFYLVFVLGVLNFFTLNYGPLALFTLNGSVRLGGEVGGAVAGSVTWLAALRVLAIFVAATLISSPRLSLYVVKVTGRLLIYSYVLFVVMVKGLLSATRRIFRLKVQNRSAESHNMEGMGHFGIAAPSVVSTPLSEVAQLRQALGSEINTDVAGPISQPAPHAISMLEADSLMNDREEELSEDGSDGPNSVPSELQTIEQPQSTPNGKFNRYWDRPSGRLNGENGQSKGLVANNIDDGDSNSNMPKLDILSTSWTRPPADLLVDSPESGISEGEMLETAETIQRTMAEYSVEVEIGQIKPGPAVTMYGLIPGWVRKYKQVKVTDEKGRPKLDDAGKPTVTRAETKTRVKVDTILSREKDLALALKTPSLRIETPVMGESLVGIEVPNPAPGLVALRGVVESSEFQELRSNAALPIALGKGSGGESVVVDLAKAPHLLIAGATGSGKSVCMNTILSCLIMEKAPDEMRLLLVDPKRVELTPYNGIPHLLTPVVVETDQVVAFLKGLIREMTQRYRRMEEVGARNIESYNARMSDHMPYLVVAVDELADLMMSASFDVEQSLCRLAQLGRATGIHLIVATQRPSVDVVTGLIKANFPSRISFGVTSQIDSRTILDTVGAEKLLGRGDMLYLPVEASRPERVQGVYISDSEIERIVGFWEATPSGPLPAISLKAVSGDEDAAGDVDHGDSQDDTDEFLDKAIELAYHHKKLSTSLLQRRLRIGYPRAARLMDQLEDSGVVGPGDGSKSRDVIISTR